MELKKELEPLTAYKIGDFVITLLVNGDIKVIVEPNRLSIIVKPKSDNSVHLSTVKN